MDENFLYKQIAQSVWQEIHQGKIKPGERLPTVRQMAQKWGCTVGTVQRAYQELAQQGMLVSHAGQGTRVAGGAPIQESIPVRRIALAHRAETFLLEVLTAGYQPEEVEEAIRLVIDRWRVAQQTPALPAENVLRFAGSHDLLIAWLAAHFSEIVPGFSLQISFRGSLGGLIALAQGEAEFAGSHLWDEEANQYNVPFVRRLLPGKKVALVTLAYRRLGLILPAGNPAGVSGLGDLSRGDLRFVNRQAGSGTRVWLDASLRKAGISPDRVLRYQDEKSTHSEVALAVAEGRADVGLGLEAFAQAYGLDFILLTRERYDLVICEQCYALASVQKLVSWLGSPRARSVFSPQAGYETQEIGKIHWID